MFKNIRADIDTALDRDPAAKSKFEVFFAYPGVHALIYYRAAHYLWNKGFYAFGRIISNFGRSLTGIEIHPGAMIGKGVFIDHGMGLVIGETAVVGNNVTLYQGVTLGGTSLESGVKRHPTLEEGVIVGAGAKILGPMIIGKNARIGSNAVVLSEIPKNAIAVGIPAKIIEPEKQEQEEDFCAYGMRQDDLADPITASLDKMFDEICALRSRLKDLEKKN
jgi:serine O-acetyltransferase